MLKILKNLFSFLKHLILGKPSEDEKYEAKLKEDIEKLKDDIEDIDKEDNSLNDNIDYLNGK